MSTITAPPNRDGLVLHNKDVLVVEHQGSASNTTINAGGKLDVLRGEASDHTIVNSLGVERVSEGGSSSDTLIHRGGREVVDRGISDNPQIMGGREFVDHHGAVNDATIGNSGQLELFLGGRVNNVTFTDQGRNSVLLDNPQNLHGTITNWRVGDYVDLAETRATSVSEAGNVLTVTYEDGRHTSPIRSRTSSRTPISPFETTAKAARISCSWRGFSHYITTTSCSKFVW
jgi:autotransporter passenger strand-loop-strand repeat protein